MALFSKFVYVTEFLCYRLQCTMYTFTFIRGIGGGELLLIFLVFLVLFGTKRIPELARGLGRGIREFRNAAKEVQEDLEDRPSEKKDK